MLEIGLNLNLGLLCCWIQMEMSLMVVPWCRRVKVLCHVIVM